MAAYLTQELDWGSCTDTATNAADAELFANPALECASVEVPLDYDAPAGRGHSSPSPVSPPGERPRDRC
nr:hypothetical protein [Pseudonocardia sp. AL041005-10]